MRTWASPGPGRLFYRNANQGNPENLKRPQSWDQATARQGLEPAPYPRCLSPRSGSMVRAEQMGKAICRAENAVAPPAPGRVRKSTPEAFHRLGPESSLSGEKHPPGGTEPWQDYRSGSTLSPKRFTSSESTVTPKAPDPSLSTRSQKHHVFTGNIAFQRLQKEVSPWTPDTVSLQEQTVVFVRFFFETSLGKVSLLGLR